MNLVGMAQGMMDENIADAGDATLTKTAFDAILNMIVAGELAGGTVVNDRRLAERLGFSRTPVREALGRLEGEGYLRRSGRTLLINSVDLGEILEILTVRSALEGESARLAVGRMTTSTIAGVRDAVIGMQRPGEVNADHHWGVDDLVHFSIAQASGNRLLARLIADLRKRTRIFGFSQIPNRFDPGKSEHLAILAAIEAGDRDRAEEAMRQHIANARTGIIKLMTEGVSR